MHFHMQILPLRPSVAFSTFFFFSSAHAHYLLSKREENVFATHQARTEADDGGVLRFSVHVSFIKTVPVHRFVLLHFLFLLVRPVHRANDGYGIKRRNKSRLERQVQVIVPTEGGESVMHVLGFPVCRFRVVIGAPLPASEVRALGQRVPGLGHSDGRHDLVRSGVLQ